MKADRISAIADARHVLESRAAPPENICTAIVSIGKPYDAEVITAKAGLVSMYLDHSDHVVRYNAIWFLGSWGHLPAYASHIYKAAQADQDVQNRAYSARSLGSILRQQKDASLTKHLLNLVQSEHEVMEVRLSAYSGLLYAWSRADAFAFLIGEKAISDVDRTFISQLQAWIQQQGEMPQVTRPRGIARSLFHAWRTGFLASRQ